MLRERMLRTGLKTRIFGTKIYTFETIDSTNNCAKAVAACGAVEGTVVFSEQQTSGKGRLGRLWVANPNENLTFSVILRPRITPDQLDVLPLYVAVAVAQAVEKATGLDVVCKWPNDLLIRGKKFAGILIEGSVKQNNVEYVVVGIGINVNQRQFAADLASKATSLQLEGKGEIDRAILFRETLVSLESNYTKVSSDGFDSVLPLWLGRTKMLNKPVSVLQQGQTFTGIMKGLSPEGGLVLLADGIEKVLTAPEATVIRM